MQSAARSNFFKVMDRSALERAIHDGHLLGELEVVEGSDDNEGLVALVATTADGDWPEWQYSEETREDEELDVAYFWRRISNRAGWRSSSKSDTRSHAF